VTSQPPDDPLLKTQLSISGDEVRSVTLEADRVPVLIVLHGGEIGRRYLLNEPSLVIGRHPQRAQLMLQGDLEVSSTHARIEQTGGRFSVTDLGSLNGSFLNGQVLRRGEPLALDDGDKLFIGRSVLKFTFQDELEEDFHVRVERMMNIDELTGLVVKRAFDRRLEFTLGIAASDHKPLTALMMDMDGLKQINDSHGHHVGAGTIAQVGRILGEIVNPRGCVTRFGGDEFTAFLEDCPRADGLDVAERIRAAVEGDDFRFGKAVVHPTISIGLSSCPEDGTQPAEVVRAADAALYRAKGAGRNCVSQ
jgi:two-component system, cell cycle response regulator